jgi:hypothetical protein
MLRNASTRRIERTRKAISAAATNPSQVAIRVGFAKFVSTRFDQLGAALYLSLHIVAPDRTMGTSAFGHGSDEAIAIVMLLRIAAQLVSASADLFSKGRAYATAALVRQVVEVEYLAWAFETRDHFAERWLRSNEKERQDFFKRAKLRGRNYERKLSSSNGHLKCRQVLVNGNPMTGS